MILAIDSATRQLSIALHDGQRVAAESSWRAAATHSVELAPQVALLLRRAGAEPAGLAGVAVARGPGSYTSLRIGLGLAKGLAMAHALPLIGVPTFDIILRGLGPLAGPLAGAAARVLAVIAAGRGRAVAAEYLWDGRAWSPQGAARLAAWADLAADARPETLLCGEWEAAPPEALRALRANPALKLQTAAGALRRAGFLAEIGWERLNAGQVDDALRLAPVYAGQPDGSPA